MKKKKFKKFFKSLLFLLLLLLLVYFAYKVIGLSSGKVSGKNDLESLGYNKEEISSLENNLSEEEIKEIDKYDESVAKFVEHKYFVYDNLDRYISYSEETNYSVDEVIMYVNIGIDKEFYTDIKEVSNSSDLLVLCNKYNALSSSYEPSDLTEVGSSGVYMRKEAADNMTSLFYAALEDGVTIYMLSGYRSYSYQYDLYNKYVSIDGVDEADTYSARAGHSEHQTGLAMDVTNEYWINDESFEDTVQFEWLQENAHKFGFIMRYPKGKEFITGYIYEPWHYRYVGVEVATVIHEEGITYEEYVVKYMTEY